SRRLAPTSPANALRRGLAVGLLPRDHRISQHADLLDLRLHYVARLQVQLRGVGAEPGETGDRACREHVARRVTEGRVMRVDLRDRYRHVPAVRALPRLAV